MKRGFTLAEVLITLGIIGVAAAMTLPALINKIHDKQYKVAYKKAYRNLSVAFLNMRAAGEYLSPYDNYYIGDTDENRGVMYSPNIGENFKLIAKYFKSAKVCFDRNADKCWYCNGEAGKYGSAPPAYVGCTVNSYAFVDASGMAWYLYSNSEYPVLVDVNGNKKPNKLGQDRFVMKFASNADKSVSYTSEADIIAPWNDKTVKGRWCPSGSCLYQSWLLE